MQKIGNGVYGNVYLDKKSNLAIKRSFHDDNIRVWNGNLTEMDILTRCGNHPNIVKPEHVEMNTEDTPKFNRLALHMKAYRTNLERYIYKNSPIEIDEIRIIMAQILLGLEYLHINRTIHRDLKPANILYNPDTKELAICDFGMANIYMQHRKQDFNITSENFRAPEVYRKKRYDYKIDIWAAGLIFGALLKGKDCPFDFPEDEFSKIEEEIDQLKIDEKNLSEKSTERKMIYQKIKNLRCLSTDIILNAISEMDIYKIYKNETFEALLNDMLKFDHNKRITASEALNYSFFDPVRESIIERNRKIQPPITMKLRAMKISPSRDERKWIKKYTLNFIDRYSDSNCETLYPQVFHGIDIFEKYLEYVIKNEKHLNEYEVYLYLNVCFYIAHKYYSQTIVPIDYREFFPKNLSDEDSLKRGESFETYVIKEILKFQIFEYTLYELSEELLINKNTITSYDYYSLLIEYFKVTSDISIIKIDKKYSYRSLFREYFFKRDRTLMI